VKLTGGAKAASIIELTPISGGWQRPRVLRTKIDDLEIKSGSSCIMFVSTTPGSAALKNGNFNIQNNLSILCVFSKLLLSGPSQTNNQTDLI
jgi:hypothetical protein